MGCSNADLGLSWLASAQTWYVVQRNELTSYSDVRFGPRCQPKSNQELGPGVSVAYAGCLSEFSQKLVLRDLDLKGEGCGPPR